MNLPLFLIIYSVPMLFTYIARYGAFAALASSSPGETVTGMIIMMVISYLIMGIAAYYRGRRIGKSGIAAFPIIGGFFDIILAFIPFVPTIMNITVLVMSISSQSPREVVMIDKVKMTDEKES